MTALGYLDEFRKNEKKRESLLNWDAGDLRRDLSASNSVVTTWQISFERIRQERPSAVDLLLLMSFFNPQGIPESLLRGYSKNKEETYNRDKPNDKFNEETYNRDKPNDKFNEDYDRLQAFSLIVVTADNNICEMHALVQFYTQVWLSSSGDVWRWRQEVYKANSTGVPY
jgi:hypothetical protein